MKDIIKSDISKSLTNSKEDNGGHFLLLFIERRMTFPSCLLYLKKINTLYIMLTRKYIALLMDMIYKYLLKCVGLKFHKYFTFGILIYFCFLFMFLHYVNLCHSLQYPCTIFSAFYLLNSASPETHTHGTEIGFFYAWYMHF